MSYFENVAIRAKSTGKSFPIGELNLVPNEEANVIIDVAGNLITRGAIITDEGSTYDPFAGTSLDAFWTTVNTGAGTIAVADSKCSLTTDTSAGTGMGVFADIDYSPISLSCVATISQRIADQIIFIGFADTDNPMTMTQNAFFKFIGTDDTIIRCYSQSSTDTNSYEGDIDIVLPNGYKTTENLLYKIDFNGETIRFWVGKNIDNLILVATHSIQTPNTYQVLKAGLYIINSDATASPTTVAVDTIFIKNYDKIDTRAEVTGDVRIQQNVVASTVNSSTTTLDEKGHSGNTDEFIGKAESSMNVAGIQVAFHAGTNCTVYIEQSQNGTDWDISDSYLFQPFIDANFGITVQAVSNFFRVRVQNEDATRTTGSLRLQSIMCPIVEALPRSLDDKGNLKTTINEITDHYGFEIENTPSGEMRAIEPVRMVGVLFEGTTIDHNFWSDYTLSGGTVTQSGGKISLDSGTDPTGLASLESVRRGRYVPSVNMRVRMQVRLSDNGVANNYRRWGAWDTNDGCYFELHGTVLSAVTMTGGVATPVASTSWNKNRLVPDISNLHTYEIYYSTSKVWFVIDENLMHIASSPIDPWTSTYNLPCRMENWNDGNTTDCYIRTRSFTLFKLGTLYTATKGTNIDGSVSQQVLKYSAGSLHSIIINAPVDGAEIFVYDSLTASNQMLKIVLPTGSQPQALAYHFDFYTGLTITTASATGLNISIVYE